MPPRKSNRPSIAAPAVASDFQPLPSRFQTSYGSEISHRVHNPRRGQKRDISDAIDEALEKDTQADFDSGSELDAGSDFAPDDDEDDDDVFTSRRQRTAKGGAAPSTQPPPPAQAAKPQSHLPQLPVSHLARLVASSSLPKPAQTDAAPTASNPVLATPPPAARRRLAASAALPDGAPSTSGTDPPSSPVAPASQDTVRSYGNESTIYRATVLNSPLATTAGAAQRNKDKAPDGTARSGRQHATSQDSRAEGVPTILQSISNHLRRMASRGTTATTGAPAVDSAIVKATSSASRKSNTGAGPARAADTPVGQNRLAKSWASYILFAIVFVLLVEVRILNLGANPRVSLKPSYGRFHWYGFSDLSHNLGQFNPFLVSFGNAGSGISAGSLAEWDYEMARFDRTLDIHDSALNRLGEFLPKVVHLKLNSNGRPIITDDFYFALRDLVFADPSFVTLKSTKAGLDFTSEDHWLAFKRRLEKDPTFQNTSKKESSPGPSPVDLDRAVAVSWDSWVKTNQDKIAKDLKGVVVTREDFIRQLKSEIAPHQQEVKAQFADMQRALSQQAGEIARLAKEMTKSGSGSGEVVTKASVEKLVKSYFRVLRDSTQLDSLAKKKIKASWDGELRHHVNFLSPRRSGARIDALRTSPTWVPARNAKSAPLFRVGSQVLKPLQPRPLPAIETLTRWEEDGECWCGAITVDANGRSAGVDLVVQLGHHIIPQHIVVEHILPGATLDPNARPKAIEIWAEIEEVGLRQRIEDFAATHFPAQYDARHNPPKLNDGFVQIGQFTYDSTETDDGVYVHKLSEELVALGAATSHVRIVAVSNYGSEDHTCLYRVRMYGELQEEIFS